MWDMRAVVAVMEISQMAEAAEAVVRLGLMVQELQDRVQILRMAQMVGKVIIFPEDHRAWAEQADLLAVHQAVMVQNGMPHMDLVAAAAAEVPEPATGRLVLMEPTAGAMVQEAAEAAKEDETAQLGVLEVTAIKES
jgi:hypothetical protein